MRPLRLHGSPSTRGSQIGACAESAAVLPPIGMVQANMGQLVTSSTPNCAIFLPFSTYDEPMMSRDHNTKHKQLTNTATMVVEPPNPPAVWIYESMPPPEGRAALRMFVARPPSRGIDRFIILT